MQIISINNKSPHFLPHNLAPSPHHSLFWSVTPATGSSSAGPFVNLHPFLSIISPRTLFSEQKGMQNRIVKCNIFFASHGICKMEFGFPFCAFCFLYIQIYLSHFDVAYMEGYYLFYMLMHLWSWLLSRLMRRPSHLVVRLAKSGLHNLLSVYESIHLERQKSGSFG